MGWRRIDRDGWECVAGPEDCRLATSFHGRAAVPMDGSALMGVKAIQVSARGWVGVFRAAGSMMQVVVVMMMVQDRKALASLDVNLDAALARIVVPELVTRAAVDDRDCDDSKQQDKQKEKEEESGALDSGRIALFSLLMHQTVAGVAGELQQTITGMEAE